MDDATHRVSDGQAAPDASYDSPLAERSYADRQSDLEIIIGNLARETRNRTPRRVGSRDRLKSHVEALMAQSYSIRQNEQRLRDRIKELEAAGQEHERLIHQLQASLTEQLGQNLKMAESIKRLRDSGARPPERRRDSEPSSAVETASRTLPGNAEPQRVLHATTGRDDRWSMRAAAERAAREGTDSNQPRRGPLAHGRNGQPLWRHVFSMAGVVTCAGAIVGGVGAGLDIVPLLDGGICVAVAGVALMILLVVVKVVVTIVARTHKHVLDPVARRHAMVTGVGNFFSTCGRLLSRRPAE
ncbi:MAG: hypothetical protein O3A51_10425 [Verrucomicrobia bacterium]|nr:hypothetical protein [Verrucomicrobiota bacterium]